MEVCKSLKVRALFQKHQCFENLVNNLVKPDQCTKYFLGSKETEFLRDKIFRLYMLLYNSCTTLKSPRGIILS